ncbi:MAG: VWA domain-containing protein [Myxococcales bacterium]|nr:VWA domain-containing protein [Myxococcales bacterium]
MTQRPSPAPSSLEARTERTLVHARTGGSRHVHVVYTAPTRDADRPRLPMNLSFVIDRSGSMGNGKLEFAKAATLEGVRLLGATDRYSVVSYDDTMHVPIPSRTAGAGHADDARHLLLPLRPGGSTDLCGGWLTGCGQIAEFLTDGQTARCLLFTDGQVNCGETEPDLLARHATELRARGITTSTFGIGSNFDEVLLRRIADEGGGQARFIESSADFSRLLREELNDALDVVHRHAELRIERPVGVTVEAVGPWPSRRDGSTLILSLGDLVSSERFECVLRVHCPPGPVGSTTTITLAVADRDGTVTAAPVSCTWRWVSGAESKAQPRELTVDRITAQRHAARAREVAVLANRNRDYGEARRLLDRVATRIARYAGTDPVLVEIVAALQRDAVEYGLTMTAMQQKQLHFESTSSLRGKTSSGSAQRTRSES